MSWASRQWVEQQLKKFKGGGGGNDGVNVERLGSFIYKATFDAISEYKEGNYAFAGACTSFVRNNKTYRSFDLMYNNVAEFLVITKDFDGIALMQGLNDGKLDFNKISQLPYHLADGCNRNGIVVTEHVLFNDFDFDGTGTKANDMTKLPTVILQNVKSMAELTSNTAVNAFISNMKVPANISALDYVLHFLITDRTTTYTLCPKDDGSAYEFIDISALPKLANFKHINKATLERDDADLQDRPNGIERWNLIGDNTELKDLRFTKAYEEATRLSEFIGDAGTTKDSTDAELMPLYNAAHTAYLARTREDEEPTWQTVHAVVYGENGIESLFVQENYNKDYAGGNKEDVFRVKVMPTPTSKDVGKTYQYIGNTTSQFTKGYYYEVVESSGSYIYQNSAVQPQAEVPISDLSSAIASNTYNTQNLNIVLNNAKCMLSLMVIRQAHTLKTPITDFGENEIKLQELPALPTGYSYPGSVKVNIDVAAGQKTCMANKNEWFVSSGSKYINPNNIDASFIVKSYAPVENAYSDAEHTIPILIAEQVHNASGAAVVEANGKPKCIHSNETITINESKTVYALDQDMSQGYVYVGSYYDESGTQHTGDYWQLVEITPEIDPDYVYWCRIANSMKLYAGDYAVDEDGNLCSYSIAEHEESKLLESVGVSISDKYGYKGTVTKTLRESPATRIEVMGTINSSRELTIPAPHCLNGFDYSIIL